MAGNSSRRGAVRKAGSKKTPTTGTGGKNRRGLEGRGPTPPAEERTGHPAARRAASAARRSAEGAPAAAGSASRSTRGSDDGLRAQRPTGRTTTSRAGNEAVAGRNPVVEALRTHVPATALHVATRIETDDRVREALRLAADRGLPVLEVARPELDRMSGGAVHQGLVLTVPPYQYTSLADVLEADTTAGRAPLVVALDGVTDPRNLGAVVRTAAAFGASCVLVPERRSAGMTASAWKTSAGAAARLPVARETNLTRALEAAKAAGCFVIGLDADADAPIGSDDVARIAEGPVAVVVGSEGRGLSRLVRETCDLVASIPMAGQVESLNAGVACSIALYEVARAREAAGARARL